MARRPVTLNLNLDTIPEDIPRLVVKELRTRAKACHEYADSYRQKAEDYMNKYRNLTEYADLMEERYR